MDNVEKERGGTQIRSNNELCNMRRSHETISDTDRGKKIHKNDTDENTNPDTQNRREETTTDNDTE